MTIETLFLAIFDSRSSIFKRFFRLPPIRREYINREKYIDYIFDN